MNPYSSVQLSCEIAVSDFRINTITTASFIPAICSQLIRHLVSCHKCCESDIIFHFRNTDYFTPEIPRLNKLYFYNLRVGPSEVVLQRRIDKLFAIPKYHFKNFIL